MQKIQLDLTNHPISKLLSDKVRTSRIEIIEDNNKGEEQFVIDFDLIQSDVKNKQSRKGSIIASNSFPGMN